MIKDIKDIRLIVNEQTGNLGKTETILKKKRVKCKLWN